MPDKWAQYIQSEGSPQSTKADRWSQYAVPQQQDEDTGEPGSSPDNPLDTEPEDKPISRIALMNATANSAHATREIQRLGFEAVDKGDYDIRIKSKLDNKWHRLDPQGGGFVENLKDVTDVIGGASNLAAQTIGHVLGGIGGAAVGTLTGGPGPGTAIGAAGGSMAGGSAGAGLEEGARVGLLGRLAGFNPSAEETVKAAGREAAYGLGGEVLAAATKPVAKLAGKALGKLSEGAAAVEKKLIPKEVASREIAQDALELNAKTAPALAEKASARAEVVAARQQWREDLQAARDQVEEKINKLRETKIQPDVESTAETARAAKTLNVIQELESAAAKDGESGLDRAMYDRLGIDILRPDKVMAKYVRRWPAFQKILKESFGDNFYTDITSASMDTRSGALRHLLRNEPERLANGTDLFKELISKELLTNPEYSQIIKEAGAESSLKRMALRHGTPGDIEALNRAINQAAEKQGRPDYLVKAIEKYQATEPAAAKALADRAAGHADFAARRAAIGIDERLPTKISNLLDPLTQAGRVAGAIGRRADRVSAWLLSAPHEQLLAAAESAPIPIKSQILRLLKNRTRTAIMMAMRLPGFRDWAESAMGLQVPNG